MRRYFVLHCKYHATRTSAGLIHYGEETMKFYSKPVPEHKEVPLADNGRLEEIIDHWTKRESAATSAVSSVNRCYVVSVGRERDSNIRKAQLSEILNLVEAQGDIIVGSEIYHLTRPHPQTLIGKGTSRAIAERASALGATMIVLDAELSPSQMRNLEDAAGMSICDREGVILNVFLKHAKTRKARVCVEIAQLEYLRPRIRGIGINMDQQAGGIGGSRGPGETASELLARKLDGRLADLKKSLRKIEQGGVVERKGRDTCKRIVLVGYTNAGKTSLMNALTDEVLSAKQMPFETLDTTSRALSRHGGDVTISDTVGFIRRLPEGLMASFESTLAEISDASLIVIVVDASDYEWQEHIAITAQMLDKLGAENTPRFYVFNKADRLTSVSDQVFNDECKPHPCELLSSKDEIATSKLKDRLLEYARSEHSTTTLFVPYNATEVLSLIYSKSRVLSTESTITGLKLRVSAEQSEIEKIKHKLKEVK